MLVGGRPTRNVPRGSDSIENGAVDRGGLRDGNAASLSTDAIASVVLVYTAKTIGLDSTVLVWSWDRWHGGKALR
jgi:hypothetical protein